MTEHRDTKPYWNAVASIARRRRRLNNSMAHTPRPSPADIERWRTMETEIAKLEAVLCELRPDRHSPTPGQNEDGSHANA